MDAETHAAAAANLADWHDLSMRALGRRTLREGGLWWCEDPAPSHYFTGITLVSADFSAEQEASIAERSLGRPRETITVCDAFHALDLSSYGFEVVSESAWMVREPAEPVRGPFPPGLSIHRVATDTQLNEWEAASTAGFGLAETTDWEATPESLLQDWRFEGPLQVFAGRVDGKVAAGSMAWIGDRVVGVYAVSVAPGVRRRGIGEWLTWRAVLSRPQLPAVLQPSDSSRAIYRRMGFVEAWPYRVWRRPAAG